MAKTSGGNRGGGNSSSAKKAIDSIEQKIRYSKIENVAVVDSKGNIIGQGKGKPNQVKVPVDSLNKLKDATITHNHPASGTFSREDITLAISGDVAEIRAVSKEGTYSLKRPKDGWGVSSSNFNEEYNKISKRVTTKQDEFIRSYNGDRREAIIKSMEMFDVSSIAIKELSKKHGWKYSHKKV